MGIGRLYNKRNQEYHGQGPVGSTTGLLDVLDVSIDEFRDIRNSDSAQRLFREQADLRDSEFEKIVGQKLSPEMSPNYDQAEIDAHRTARDYDGIYNLNERWKNEAVEELRKKDPDKFKSILSTEQLHEKAKDKARLSRKKYEETIARAEPGFTTSAAEFAGAFMGAATDPLNIATMVIGAGASTSLIKTMLIEAGVNMATEAAIQPSVAEWNRELGFKYGFGDAASEVAMAGLFGAGFVGVGRGIKVGGSHVFNRVADKYKQYSLAKGLAQRLERYAHIEEANPHIREENLALRQKHIDTAIEVSEKLNRGEKIDADALPISRAEFNAIDTTPRPEDGPLIREKLKQIEKFQDKTELKKPSDVPSFTKETLPQQILHKAIDDTSIKDTKIKEFKFTSEEKQMLKEAGIKPARGEYDLKPFVKEADKRIKNKEWDASLAKDDISHIDEFHLERQADTPAGADISANDGTRVDPNIRDSEMKQELADAITPRKPRTSEEIKTFNEFHESDVFEKAERQNFDRLLEDDPEVLVHLEDGDMTLDEIRRSFGNDQKLIDAITSCGIGV